MALIPWKEGLPECAQSWEEMDEPNVIRTNVDVGPPKVRRRSTLQLRSVKVGWTMPAEKYELLMEFYETDCLQGINEFEYAHPVTKAVNRYRFSGSPKITMIKGKVGVGAIKVECEWEMQF